MRKKYIWILCFINILFMLARMLASNDKYIVLCSSWGMILYLLVCYAICLCDVIEKNTVKGMGKFIAQVGALGVNFSLNSLELGYMESNVLCVTCSVLYIIIAKQVAKCGNANKQETYMSKHEIKNYIEQMILSEKKDRFQVGYTLNIYGVCMMFGLFIIQGVGWTDILGGKMILGILLFIILGGFITIDIKKYIFLRLDIRYCIVELVLIVMEIIFFIKYETLSINFYFMLWKLYLWTPFIASSIIIGRQNKDEK